MKKIMASILVLLFLNVAHADIIECSFTEPFYTTTYSMTQSTLTYREDVEGKVQVIKNVSFQIKAPGIFELVAQNGKVLQTLTLNNKGSDGMSDVVYPYDVKDNSAALAGAGGGFGGCTSNYLKAK